MTIQSKVAKPASSGKAKCPAPQVAWTYADWKERVPAMEDLWQTIIEDPEILAEVERLWTAHGRQRDIDFLEVVVKKEALQRKSRRPAPELLGTRIIGNITEPVVPESDWEALRESDS